MRHWLTLADYTPRELADLVTLGARIKRGAAEAETHALRGRGLVMVFFNPSLRTRTSFEAGMARFGGHAICLSVGGDTWQLEYRDGVVMDGAAAEHVREAAPVLSRYGDLLAVRTFAGLKDAAEDARDGVLRAFAAHATVPVINMESAIDHPCQGLADWLTMREKLGDTAGKRFTLRWAPQVKGLPLAVPHAALLAAGAAGMEVTIAHPPGYELNEDVLATARRWCQQAGTSLRVVNEREADRSSDVLYVKSWGAAGMYGDAERQRASFAEHRAWMVTRENLGAQTRLMHCLPVRRNVVVADDALDDPRCIVVDQAENRLWAQVAIMARLLADRARKE